MAPEIGAHAERLEDPGLLKGSTPFVNDLSEPRMAHAAILRSQYGHAEIVDIDISGAVEHDSVIAVYTGDDIADSDIPGTIPFQFTPPESDDPDVRTNTRKELVVPPRPLLAQEKVRYAGQPVALVIATDRYDARDALDLIDVTYDRLDAVVHPSDALAEDAAALHDEAPDNLAFDWEVGEEAAIEEVFDDAPNVVEITRDNQRLIGNPIEPRGALATYDSGNGRLDVRMGTQAPHLHRRLFSAALGLSEERIRVSAPAVGGGFGVKGKWFPGEVLAGWASMETGRPVKWIATRSESFLSDNQGRGFDSVAELALDDDGTILGLRVHTLKDLGAFIARAGVVVGTGSYAKLLSGQYTIPEIYCRVQGVFTNMTPTDAYRGSGRPEAVYVVERLISRAADELGIDPAEIRRRNFIQPDEFPYDTPVMAVYDSGDYGTAFDRALELLDYEEVRERQKDLREEGRYLGIGFSCFVEHAGASPPAGEGDTPAMSESARVAFTPSGTVTAACGTSDVGQGHRTSYTQILADKLGIPSEDIQIEQGDSGLLPHGTGSFGSRSAIMGGNAIAECAEKIIERGRELAAHKLEATPEDIDFEDGEYFVSGAPDRSLSISAIAGQAYSGVDLPEDFEPSLQASTVYASEGYTYPFGAHAAVVEIEVETGDIDLVKYVAVDDCGVQINPEIVEGQVIGGTVQGIGAALFEGAVYNDTGTLVTASFQDYTMPRANNVPDIETDHTVTPSPANALGVKGTGESGTIGAPAALVNAAVDALSPFGVDHLKMPLTPETLRDAVRQ